MKQIILLSFFLLSNLGLVKAQYEITPNDITLDTLVDLTDEYVSGKMHSDINNNTSSEVELRWEIVSIDAPVEWQPQLCVNNESGGCFSWDVLSNTAAALPNAIPLTIQANDHSIFDMGVRPRSVAGCGTYEIRVAPMDDQSNIVVIGTYTFKYNVDENCVPLESTSTNNFDKSLVKIFPNPTNDYFTITENAYVESIQIFNIVGKQMAATNFQSGDAINISSFPNGLYLVRMLDNDGDVLKTTRLTKR
ncbi:MAG: T9SS type A sorting domain-containing protein [Saprospiraceae bacterium]